MNAGRNIRKPTASAGRRNAEAQEVLRVTGAICFQRQLLLISSALGGWSVGLAPSDHGLMDVHFAHLPIGQINPKTASFQAARSGGLKARPSHPNV